MKYEISSCGESDIEYIWEKAFEAVPVAENAREEQLVFKVTDEQGAIIGGCVLDIDETKTAEFERLWVDERYRRQGMGSALIRAAEQAAREKGCRTLVNAYTFEFQTSIGICDHRLISGNITRIIVGIWCYISNVNLISI